MERHNTTSTSTTLLTFDDKGIYVMPPRFDRSMLEKSPGKVNVLRNFLKRYLVMFKDGTT